jgi:uncharacterized protein (DUF1697 family)
VAVRIVLLRGVNVGGANRVSMKDLCAVAASLGFAGARSLLQTGNLVIDGQPEGAPALEGRFEAAFKADLGLDVDVVVREPGEWRTMVSSNPFPDAAEHEPSRLQVVVLKSTPGADREGRLRAACRDGEAVRLVGREAFIHYPAGIGGSRLVNAVIDRALGARGTARNWNTVLKLAAMLT